MLGVNVLSMRLGVAALVHCILKFPVRARPLVDEECG
jgi:hypothetical protein